MSLKLHLTLGLGHLFIELLVKVLLLRVHEIFELLAHGRVFGARFIQVFHVLELSGVRGIPVRVGQEIDVSDDIRAYLLVSQQVQVMWLQNLLPDIAEAWQSVNIFVVKVQSH